MTDSINELMDRDPTQLTKENVDAIIEHYRNLRARGDRPKKETGPKQTTSLEALGLAAPKPIVPMRRL